ncbi:MAG: hypothetical protein H6719_03935 [Sandaracinaceae bacterium]|nr:hypothetical protein [Sandaracinaceae bacterium]
MSERRLSTPAVLAAASAMLAVAAVVVLSQRGDAPEPLEPEAPSALHIDDNTPEAAAESFYDAWRRRNWEAARALSVGAASDSVHQKQAADEALNHEERVLAERGWEALASAPLTLSIDQVDIDGDDRFSLRAVAAYDFVGTPYRRRVVMHVQGTPEGYRVSEMELGDVLTELPPMFRGGAAP